MHTLVNIVLVQNFLHPQITQLISSSFCRTSRERSNHCGAFPRIAQQLQKRVLCGVTLGQELTHHLPDTDPTSALSLLFQISEGIQLCQVPS